MARTQQDWFSIFDYHRRIMEERLALLYRFEQFLQQLPAAAFRPGVWERLTPPGEICLVATGPMVSEALAVREMLSTQGLQAQVVNASSVKPLDMDFLGELTRLDIPYYVLEEQALAGGLGSAVSEACVQRQLKLPDYLFALKDVFVPHGSHDRLLAHCGLDARSIADSLLGMRRMVS